MKRRIEELADEINDYTAVRDREFATIDPTLQKLLGRAPITVRQLMTDAARG